MKRYKNLDIEEKDSSLETYNHFSTNLYEHPSLQSSTSPSIALKVDHVSKKYCKSLKRSMLYGIADIGKNMFGMSSHSERLRKGEFWAVNEISFELKKGETLGIIGPNGSGKTTLLKMLNGIFWPDKGEITVNGRVGALIAVGAGFHPLLTGRENIYINAAILGMRKKEVDERFNEIIEFADIGDFIDTPVKYYSSGMFVRLGFAIAIHCRPDILLIDEILAVGDIDFQNRCLNRISQLKGNISSIIVSHNMNTIRLMCDRCLFLFKGNQKKIGDVSEVLSNYIKDVFKVNNKEYISKNLDIKILDENNLISNLLIINEKYQFEFIIKDIFLNKGLLISFSFLNLANNYNHRIEIDKFLHVVNKINKFSFRMTLKKISLPPGEYTIRFAISDGHFLNRIFYVEQTILFSIEEAKNNRFLNYIIT